MAAGAQVSLAEDGTVTDVAIGLTAAGVDHTIEEAGAVLKGKKPTEDLFIKAGRLAAAASDPIADQRGPIDYKRHLADELTRRVLRRACERAGKAQNTTTQEG